MSNKGSMTTLLIVALLALGVMAFIGFNNDASGAFADPRGGGGFERGGGAIGGLPRPEGGGIIPDHPPINGKRPWKPIVVNPSNTYVYQDSYPDYVAEPTYAATDPNTQYQICVIAREFNNPSDNVKTLLATYCHG